MKSFIKGVEVPNIKQKHRVNNILTVKNKNSMKI